MWQTELCPCEFRGHRFTDSVQETFDSAQKYVDQEEKRKIERPGQNYMLQKYISFVIFSSRRKRLSK